MERYTSHSSAGGLSQWTARSGHRLHVASTGGTEISTGRWTVLMRCSRKKKIVKLGDANDKQRIDKNVTTI